MTILVIFVCFYIMKYVFLLFFYLFALMNNVNSMKNNELTKPHPIARLAEIDLTTVQGCIFDVDDVLVKRTKDQSGRDILAVKDAESVQKIFQSCVDQNIPAYLCSASFHPLNYTKIQNVFCLLEKGVPAFTTLFQNLPNEFDETMCRQGDLSPNASSIEPTEKKFEIFQPIANVVSAYPRSLDRNMVLQYCGFETNEGVVKGAYTKDVAINEILKSNEGKTFAFIDDFKPMCDKICASCPTVQVFHLAPRITP